MSEFQTFYEILHFSLVILTNFLKEIWFLFGLFETAYGQICLFIFLNLATLKTHLLTMTAFSGPKGCVDCT